MVPADVSPNHRSQSYNALSTHWYVGEIFQSTLLPGIGNKSLSPLIGCLSERQEIISRCAALAGQVEEASGAMICNAASLVQLEPPELARHGGMILGRKPGLRRDIMGAKRRRARM